MNPIDILCSECGEDSILRREPVYEGFKKTGEKLLCSACGHEYADEESVPFKVSKVPSIFDEDDAPRKYDIFSDSDRPVRPEIFSDDDKSEVVDVFKSEEKGRNCRHCVHYVLNPFTQKCGLHIRDVLATDLCDDFENNEDVQD